MPLQYGRPLSPRQREALELAAEGLTNAECAFRMHVDIKTVEAHMRIALQKLGAVNKTQACVRYYVGLEAARRARRPHTRRYARRV